MPDIFLEYFSQILEDNTLVAILFIDLNTIIDFIDTYYYSLLECLIVFSTILELQSIFIHPQVKLLKPAMPDYDSFLSRTCSNKSGFTSVSFFI